MRRKKRTDPDGSVLFLCNVRGLASRSGFAGLKRLHVALEELGLPLAKLDADRFAKDLVGDDRSLLHQSAEDRNVRTLRVADGLGNAVGVAVDDLDVITLGLAVDDGAVDGSQETCLPSSMQAIARNLPIRSMP